MKKFMTFLLLAAVIFGAMTLISQTKKPPEPSVPVSTDTETPPPLPDSVLYYGTVEEIVTDEEGNITQLRMTSDRYGEYGMNIAEETFWIDSGRKAVSDSSNLQVGERIYIFHSPVATFSLPPQSAAFAVVRNIPMDVGCAQYHLVEAVSLEGDSLEITTENGSLSILADSTTTLSRYGSDGEISLQDIQPDSHVMAWYGPTEAGSVHAQHLMLLE